MSGHSKWANIKHRKGAQDAKRSKMFTRIIKEITVAVKQGGSEQETNPRLRTAMQNAKGVNMPKDTIERTIKKASGADGTSYEEVTFEGYASNGVAIFVECTTDNNNRTVANIRAIFSKYGGNLGINGSLEFIFDRKGVFTISPNQITMDLEELEMELIDGGLEELEQDDEVITIYCDFPKFSNMQKCLENLNIEIQNSEPQRIPNNTKTISAEDAKLVLKLLDLLEENDDVQQVFHNMELTDEILKTMDSE
ncbi:MAG: YebC/PmpR family DNA-binding transcriptional regulator [Bacteroidota bacterium]|nr:YebC/PmpR family DNA-binding transcriptional regulator [Bacteroidota bacterium]